MKQTQEMFEEQMESVLDDAAEKRADGNEGLAMSLEEIVYYATLDRWNWELDDSSGVKRRAIGNGKSRMGHLLKDM